MIKADKYIKETINKIFAKGSKDNNPRPKWPDGSPAHSKFITQQVFSYDISKNEFPITTLRTTALKGAFHDIEAIYIKQTNIIEKMHKSIHSWWKDFSTYKPHGENYGDTLPINSIGATYGHTVKKYDLMNKLLKGLEENPFGRRHSINLNQEQQKINDSNAIQPCAYETLWSVRDDVKSSDYVRYIDLTLVQRSMDFAVTACINPAQYVMLGMMVCGHLTHKTGIKHKIGNFLHLVQNCHIYLHNTHIKAATEISNRQPINEQPIIRLKRNTNFYNYTIDDFEFILPKGIKKLDFNLEIAV